MTKWELEHAYLKAQVVMHVFMKPVIDMFGNKPCPICRKHHKAGEGCI